MQQSNGTKRANGGFAFPAAAGAMPVLETFLTTSRTLLDTWAELSSEITEFGKKRLERRIEAFQKIAQMPDPYQAMELNAQFANETFGEYMDQAKRIAELSARRMGSLPALQNGGQQGAAQFVGRS